MVIDDFRRDDLVSKLRTPWRGVSDQVMGGVSEVSIVRQVIDGQPCLHLTGNVRLENNGGFVQATLDLTPQGDSIDVSEFTGVRLVTRGNGEQYSVHLRTTDTLRPWQSYRAHFTAGPLWQSVDLSFESFAPHRLSAPLNLKRLRRIGLVAIGRPFQADLSVTKLEFIRVLVEQPQGTVQDGRIGDPS